MLGDFQQDWKGLGFGLLPRKLKSPYSAFTQQNFIYYLLYETGQNLGGHTCLETLGQLRSFPWPLLSYLRNGLSNAPFQLCCAMEE